MYIISKPCLWSPFRFTIGVRPQNVAGVRGWSEMAVRVYAGSLLRGLFEGVGAFVGFEGNQKGFHHGGPPKKRSSILTCSTPPGTPDLLMIPEAYHLPNSTPSSQTCHTLLLSLSSVGQNGDNVIPSEAPLHSMGVVHVVHVVPMQHMVHVLHGVHVVYHVHHLHRGWSRRRLLAPAQSRDRYGVFAGFTPWIPAS